MPRLKPLIVLLAFALGAAHEASAQALTLSLFERYLETLRVQAGIPGLSAAIIQGGVVVWERGLGRQDVDGRIPATPDTPYAIANMSQALSSTLLLRNCVDQSYMSTLDPVQRWFPAFDEPQTLIGHLLAHAAPGGGFKYDPGRFASLTPVIEACTNTSYANLLASDLFDLLADLQKRFPVDPDRIYLTGVSMGGSAVLRLALTHPDLWAAVAPVCPAPLPGMEGWTRPTLLHELRSGL